jgi:hypothetical protein
MARLCSLFLSHRTRNRILSGWLAEWLFWYVFVWLDFLDIHSSDARLVCGL